MSAQSGEKWQRAGRSTPSNQNQALSQNQPRQPQNSTSNSRSNTPQQRDGGSRPNAWSNNSSNNANNRRSQATPSTPSQQQSQSNARSGQVNTAPAGQDNNREPAANATEGRQQGPSPAVSKNAKEIADMMRAAYREAVVASGSEEKALIYRGQGQSDGVSKGAKSGTMSNGTRFFAELSKQIGGL